VRAEPAALVRVAIECEIQSRTKACPAFLLGFVEANKVMLSSPRAVADVVLYASATEVALVDKMHLRFVGSIAGAPPVVEIDVDLDSCADDDTQRAQLEPAFLRGISLFVAARHPKAVEVKLAEPDQAAGAPASTTPWACSSRSAGFGNYTKQYKSAFVSSEIALSRLERRRRFEGNDRRLDKHQPPASARTGGRHRGLARLPAVVSVRRLEGAWLYNRCWSIVGVSRFGRDDPRGQHCYTWIAKAGVEWDLLPGRRSARQPVALLYFAGYQIDGYNLRNVRGERFAQYPIHSVIASGSVRKDKISIGISLPINAMLLHPGRRHNISASPFIEWKIGGHVDVNLSFSATKRELPGRTPTRSIRATTNSRRACSTRSRSRRSAR
jgi:hypothetical protein